MPYQDSALLFWYVVILVQISNQSDAAALYDRLYIVLALPKLGIVPMTWQSNAFPMKSPYKEIACFIFPNNFS